MSCAQHRSRRPAGTSRLSLAALPVLLLTSLSATAFGGAATTAPPEGSAAATGLEASAAGASAGTSAPMAGFDAYVNGALKAWGVPGAAVAVVKDGRVVHMAGYGVLEAGKPARVDENTIFPIASLTKGFTAAAVGALVDDGRLEWDDPVVRRLPGFAVADPDVTRMMTIRDLLAHRTGLSERSDLLWYGTGYDRKEILHRLAHLELQSPFRSVFTYLNVHYLVAGKVVAATAGMSWDDFIVKRFFEPLGMTRSSTGLEALKALSNVARAHTDREGGARVIPYLEGDGVAPAASINASVHDMARWLTLQLGQGTVEGQKLLSPAVVEEMHTPQIVDRMGPFQKKLYPESNFVSYGMGWVLQDYRGQKVVWNTGGMDGTTCSIAMLPGQRLGMVVLTNGPRISLPEALVFRLIDAWLQAPRKDWSGIRLEDSLARRKRQAEAKKGLETGRMKDTRPSVKLETYAGLYQQPLMGDVRVNLVGGRLELRLGALAGDLEHWHYDTFRITWRDPQMGTSMATFSLDAAGKIGRLELEEHGAFTRVER